MAASSEGFGGVTTSYLRSIHAFWNAKDAVHALRAQECLPLDSLHSTLLTYLHVPKFENTLFALPLAGEWCVMVSREDHVKDLCTAPEEVLSMESSADDVGPLYSLSTSVSDNVVRRDYSFATLSGMCSWRGRMTSR